MTRKRAGDRVGGGLSTRIVRLERSFRGWPNQRGHYPKGAMDIAITIEHEIS